MAVTDNRVEVLRTSTSDVTAAYPSIRQRSEYGVTWNPKAPESNLVSDRSGVAGSTRVYSDTDEWSSTSAKVFAAQYRSGSPETLVG